jgi:hypothetical protein
MAARIAKALQDREARVRSRAATVLDRLEAKEALPALREARAEESHDSVAAVMEGAIRSLEELRGTRRRVEVSGEWQGPDSGVATRSYRLVTGAEEWRVLWEGHRDGETAPEVDFEDSMAVAVFAGAGWNSRGIAVTITEDDETIRVRFRGRYYQTMMDGDRVTPYGIWILPRSEKTVLLEEDVHGIIGAEPEWKVRARLRPGS